MFPTFSGTFAPGRMSTWLRFASTTRYRPDVMAVAARMSTQSHGWNGAANDHILCVCPAVRRERTRQRGRAADKQSEAEQPRWSKIEAERGGVGGD